MSNNLTEGKPLKNISGFWYSVCIGNALMTLYSIVNSMIIGHILGADALGGTDTASQITNVVSGFNHGLLCGFAIPVSKAFGAMDWPRVRRLFWCSMLIGLSFAAFAMALLLPFSDALLHLMKTPQENFLHASEYLKILLLSLIPYALFNFLYYVCHAMGDSRLATIGQAIAAIVTILLEVIFVVFLGTGIAGVAWAPALANVVAGIILLVVLIRKNPNLRPQKKDFWVNEIMLKNLFSNGLSTSTGSTLMNCVGVVLQTAINSMGATYVNIYAISSRLFGILNLPFGSLDGAMKAYMCQNAGAGKHDRMRQGFRAGMVLTLISVAFFLIVILFFTKEMTWLIVGEVDAFTLQNVQKYMLIVGAFTITYGISVVYRYTPPALGHSGTIALTGGMEAVLRLIGCVLVYKVGFLGACFLMPIGWVGRGIYDVAASYHYLRKEKQKYP